METVSKLLTSYAVPSYFRTKMAYVYTGEDLPYRHPLLSLFGIFFILSSIARYHPITIDTILNDSENSESWVMDKVIRTARQLIPLIFANFLYSKHCGFKAYYVNNQ